MSVRLPSQNTKFRPKLPAAKARALSKAPLTASLPPPVSARPPRQTSIEPSDGTTSATPQPAPTHLSQPAPTPTVAIPTSETVCSSRPPELSVPPAPVAPSFIQRAPTRSRAPSVASSQVGTSLRAASIPRTGRPALIAAAVNHVSHTPSPGRLPPRTSASTASSTHGLPPTLRAASPPRATPTPSGLPPTLTINAEAGPSRITSPRHHPISTDPASLAAALVAGIVPLPGSERPPPVPPKPTKRRRAPNGKGKKSTRKRQSANVNVAHVDEGADASAETPIIGRKRKAAEPSVSDRLRRRRPNLSQTDGANGTNENGNVGNDEPDRLRTSKKRGPYSSRTVAGTPYDKRLSVNRAQRQRRKPPDPPKTHPELEGVEANQMIGSQIDPGMMTMKDLATKLMSEGKVSARALKLHAFQREEEDRKRGERLERVEATFRRKQIQRRKLRAEHNLDRARRREGAGSMRGNEDDISADSDDSEETFEPQPDRLTPPSSPGPQDLSSPVRLGAGLENQEEIGDGEVEQALAELRQQSEGAEVLERGAVGEDAPIEEDEADAALRAAGFIVADAPRADGGENEDDDDEVDWDMHQPDIDALREERDDERRRIRERMGERVIEEQDDETTMVNSTTFAKRNPVSERWTKAETEFFYMVLGETGENYTLMKAYFPGRTVQQLKRKGLRENREDSARVTAAILNRKPLDKVYLAKSAGYDDARAWDKEDALFAEARADVQKLKGVGTTMIGLDEGVPAAEQDDEVLNPDWDQLQEILQSEEAAEGEVPIAEKEG